MPKKTPNTGDVPNVDGSVQGGYTKDSVSSGGTTSVAKSTRPKDGDPRRGVNGTIDPGEFKKTLDVLDRLTRIVDQLQLTLTSLEDQVLTQEQHLKDIQRQWELRFGPAKTHCEKCGKAIGIEENHKCGGSALTQETIDYNDRKRQSNKRR